MRILIAVEYSIDTHMDLCQLDMSYACIINGYISLFCVYVSSKICLIENITVYRTFAYFVSPVICHRCHRIILIWYKAQILIRFVPLSLANSTSKNKYVVKNEATIVFHSVFP